MVTPIQRDAVLECPLVPGRPSPEGGPPPLLILLEQPGQI